MNEIDPVSNILQQIQDNPIQDISFFEDSGKQITIQIDLEKRKKIIYDWLNGMEPKDLAMKYRVSKIAINKIIDSNEDTRLEIERRYFATAAARENLRISETKNKLITYVNDALDEVLAGDSDMTAEKKVKFLSNIAMLFDKLDNTSRLNANKPTSLTEHRDVKLDVAAIIKEMHTPEDKVLFLQNQLSQMRNTYD